MSMVTHKIWIHVYSMNEAGDYEKVEYPVSGKWVHFILWLIRTGRINRNTTVSGSIRWKSDQGK